MDPLLDELLLIQQKMARRLAELQREQSELIDRLDGRIANMMQVVCAAREITRAGHEVLMGDPESCGVCGREKVRVTRPYGQYATMTVMGCPVCPPAEDETAESSPDKRLDPSRVACGRSW